jgi:hypothetical protein
VEAFFELAALEFGSVLQEAPVLLYELQISCPMTPVKVYSRGHEARISLRTLDISGHVDLYVCSVWRDY